ncbi:hypothetical protein FGO68_gene5812 [Halteria grandinella]|uniref:DUSP domain-containing protein n=1 Tax=Halteria grandinella TaxID=5974 RepID=A0A8J8NY75_HALGN|nr:hypothetical protein FGO68_gene5812 [Halteria grandinella]
MKKEAELYGVKSDGIYKNQGCYGYVNETKYLVSATWWRRWCDFANLGDQVLNDSAFNNQQRLPSNFNTHATLPDEENPSTLKQINHARNFSMYDKPGPISNEHLLLDRKAHFIDKSKKTVFAQPHYYLKYDLIEHFDYEVVSQELWTHLQSWYGADYVIPRKMRRGEVIDGGFKRKMYIELYPGKLLLALMRYYRGHNRP